MIFRNTANRQKLLSLLIIWLFSAGVGTVILATGLIAAADQLVLDRKFLLFQREYEREDIALVTIDASSLERFSTEFQLHWPWPRELYGILLDFLGSAGAQTVTFDVLFDRPDIDRIDTDGATSDRRFAEAIAQSGNVVLAANSTDEREPAFLDSEARLALHRHFIPVLSPHPSISDAFPVNLPIPPFHQAAGQVGNAYVPVRQDGVIRFTYLLMPLKNGGDENLHYPSLPLAAWLAAQGSALQQPAAFQNDQLHIRGLSVPLQPDGTYRVNWYSRGGVRDGTFPYYSFYDVFLSGLAVLQQRPEMAPLANNLFQDRHVVIGASAAGLADIKTTPFSSMEPYPGMEIQATVLANLLDGQFVGELPRILVLLLLWVILLVAILTVGMSRHINSIILALLIPSAIILTGLGAFAIYRFVLPTALFTATALLGIGTTYIFRYLTEEREKKAIKSAFSQYVQKEYVDTIAEDPKQLRLGGQQKELTVLFSDMANFTSISETLSPQELSTFLNEYLTDMTRILFEHGGTLDKFIGDAVMAFWGAPIDQPDHALRACRCALAMQAHLAQKADEWNKRGYPPVSVRIGINTGPMIVGNMGSRDRFNYTVLGDAVNLGARLEPLNKNYGTNIIISEFTHQAIERCCKEPGNPDFDREFSTRELDRITVKGKSQAVTVYEINQKVT